MELWPLVVWQSLAVIVLVRLDSLRWFSQCRRRRQVLCGRCIRFNVLPARMALFTFCIMRCDSAKRHICGGCPPRQGLWPPNLNSAVIFVRCVYPQVSSSCVYSFGSYCVDTHTHTNPSTNKQIPAKHPTFFVTLRCWVIKPAQLGFSVHYNIVILTYLLYLTSPVVHTHPGCTATAVVINCKYNHCVILIVCHTDKLMLTSCHGTISLGAILYIITILATELHGCQ